MSSFIGNFLLSPYTELEEAKKVHKHFCDLANSRTLLNANIFSSIYFLGYETENLTPGCAAK